jgi:hypothetical protein
MSCPIDAATVSTIIGLPMRQDTPDTASPWCEFQAADNKYALAVFLDDRPSSWATLAEARRAHDQDSDRHCTQIGAAALGPDAFTSLCPAANDYHFVTASTWFTRNGAIRTATVNKDERRRRPTDLVPLATAVAQSVPGPR